jgi:hypothetical protein
MQRKATVKVHVWRRTTGPVLEGAAVSEQTTVEEEGRRCHHAPEMSGSVPAMARDGYTRSGGEAAAWRRREEAESGEGDGGEVDTRLRQRLGLGSRAWLT